MRYAPEWAPDGKRTSRSATRTARSSSTAFEDKKLMQIVDAPRGQVRDYAWSPRDIYLAFSVAGANGFGVLHIWSARDGQLRRDHRRAVQRAEPGLGSRRELPLLPERSRTTAADLERGVQLRHQPHDRHLRDGPAQGRQAPLPARERRGDGEQGRQAPRPAKPRPRSPPKDKPGQRPSADTRRQAARRSPRTSPPSLTVDFDGPRRSASRACRWRPTTTRA